MNPHLELGLETPSGQISDLTKAPHGSEQCLMTQGTLSQLGSQPGALPSLVMA